ncbi:MAG: leucine-rich repeat protein [Clostridia bacterium]|nr:leucine-rich repeat protein [Clostridia bacterium]
MANYTTQQKLDIINKSASLGELPVDVMPYTQSDEYYFVSYSHADYKEVYADILRLQEQGVNIWYDRGLPAGKDWEKSAYEAIIKYSCVGVIFYLSENSLQSHSVIKEINFVKNKGKDYLSINLPLNGKSIPASEMIVQINKTCAIENEQIEIINSTFNDKVLFIDYGAPAEFKADKIRLLKRENSLKFENDTVVAVRNIDLVNVTIPEYADGTNERISHIGDCAFANCKQLERANFGNVSLGDRAFFGCESLQSVDLSETFLVGGYAFAECDSLNEVGTLPEEIGKYAFYNCKKLKSVELKLSTTRIDKGAFSGSGVRNITFKHFRHSINDYERMVMEGKAIDYKFTKRYAFDSNCLYSTIQKEIVYGFCDQNANIKTCDGATAILEKAFACQNDCVSALITKNITRIDKFAFANCDNLESVVFESCDNNEQEIIIGENAFQGCKNLKRVVFSANVTKICERAFENCSSLREIVFEKGCKLKSIAKSAFSRCISLVKVELPDNLEIIELDAFGSCENLQEISFGKRLQKIGFGAFMGCSAIERLSFPKTLEEIESSAFMLCDSISKVDFGENPKIKSIGYTAFDNTSITSFYLPGSLSSFSNNMITSSSVEQLYIEAGDTPIERVESSIISECHDLTTIAIDREIIELNSIANDCPYVEKIILANNSLKVINKNVINDLYSSRVAGYESGEDFDEVGENYFDEDEFELPIIYFGGTKQEWKQIKQTGKFLPEICEDENALIEKVVTVICVDGKV